MSIRGIRNGMVMQRDPQTNLCEIYCWIADAIAPKSTMGELTALGNGQYKLTGIPVGGPYAFEITDGETVCAFNDMYVGDVWVLAGQSNMEGVAVQTEEEIAYNKNPLSSVRCYYFDGEWRAATSAIHKRFALVDPASAGEGQPSAVKRAADFNITDVRVGPGHFIGVRLFDLTGIPQGLIPCAKGGASLMEFSPDYDVPDSLYKQMINRIADCGNHVRGMFWYQGETDGFYVDRTEAFTQNMKYFVSTFRKELGDEALPIVQAQIGVTQVSGMDTVQNCHTWHKIRAQQEAMDEEIPALCTVSVSNASYQDVIHLDAKSQKRLGHVMADQMHRMLTGEGEPIPTLREITVRAVGEKNSEIVTHYDHVCGKLCVPGDGVPHGFSVTIDDDLPFAHPYMNLGYVRLEKNRVVIGVENCYVDVNNAYLWYGAGPHTVCNIIDEKGRALLAFGPYKIVNKE